jgi:hypothetical protein
MGNGNKLSKRDRGALIFQTWNNQIQERLENVDGRELRLAFLVYEMKRRLDCLEQVVSCLRRANPGGEPEIEFFCIACGKRFGVPEPEAKAQDFTTTCPSCHNWSLPATNEDDGIATISGKQIAEATGRPYSLICQLARKNHLGHYYGPKTKLYTAQEKGKLIELLAEHPPRQ